jgi:hypothetical protein
MFPFLNFPALISTPRIKTVHTLNREYYALAKTIPHYFLSLSLPPLTVLFTTLLNTFEN